MKCWLVKRWNSCCCQCEYRDKPIESPEGESIICFEDNVSEENRHGLCEMFTAKINQCPVCKKQSMRKKVKLVVDRPVVSKSNIRKATIHIEAALWDKAIYYCTSCGWMGSTNVS